MATYPQSQFVGIDLHRRRSVFVHLDGDGQRLEVAHLVNDPDRWLAQLQHAGPAPQVVLEATYGWYWAADLLAAHGASVHLAHPLGVAGYSHRRVKNDVRDATDLAQLLRTGLLPEAWADGIGERFSEAWGIEEAWEPGEFLDAMLTNYRALGALVDDVSVTDEAAAATITGFPDEELCDVFNVRPADAAVFHRVAGEIARRRGLQWTWEQGEESTRLHVTALPE